MVSCMWGPNTFPRAATYPRACPGTTQRGLSWHATGSVCRAGVMGNPVSLLPPQELPGDRKQPVH